MYFLKNGKPVDIELLPGEMDVAKEKVKQRRADFKKKAKQDKENVKARQQRPITACPPPVVYNSCNHIEKSMPFSLFCLLGDICLTVGIVLVVMGLMA